TVALFNAPGLIVPLRWLNSHLRRLEANRPQGVRCCVGLVSWNSPRNAIVPGTCVVGLQWGDEAKGKLVDLLTSRFEIVVRYQGGANAGHTVVVADKTYKLHHVPSGILTPGVMNVVTPGVVINPPTILKEIESLTSQG